MSKPLDWALVAAIVDQALLILRTVADVEAKLVMRCRMSVNIVRLSRIIGERLPGIVLRNSVSGPGSGKLATRKTRDEINFTVLVEVIVSVH
ncbi:unnamed protein product [Fusarium venenatum]|uniref:Secreted protein n=1 Tax=Fusarium venenatum TaxID=56646 RepID=A0A2L2TTF0_9HYPO|nr:uncharacterized protein FVRRES_01062 [Fusarium venenatum]CEI64550.1 unnamed protein product [Fusarium venenatum]